MENNLPPRRIRVMIVEDSPVVRELLLHILSTDPQLEVVGLASDGVEAMELLARVKPDVVTVDMSMPRMSGFEVTRRLMETRPLPIVIISASWNPDEVATTFSAVEAGAVAVVAKPHGLRHADYAVTASRLVQTVKAMSEVKVVRRWSRSSMPVAQSAPANPRPRRETRPARVCLVAIGASTGGPVVLQTILAKLPRDFAAPVLIVQHIAAGFLPGLADWLSTTTGFQIRIAAQGDPLLPRHAYLAPDGSHLCVQGGKILLNSDDPDEGLRPSVAHLFGSVVLAYGTTAAGVLLTGMGRDGARELAIMRQKGAMTIAQDEASCVVFGMPGEAVRLGAAEYVLSPEGIAALLASAVANP
jgi:two-component system chemotaxis response regulator CheB